MLSLYFRDDNVNGNDQEDDDIPGISQQLPQVPIKGVLKGNEKLGLQGTHDLLQQDYSVEQNDFMMKRVKRMSTVIDIDDSLIVPHGDDNLIGFAGGDSPIDLTGGDNLIVSNGGGCLVDYSTYDDLVYQLNQENIFMKCSEMRAPTGGL